MRGASKAKRPECTFLGEPGSYSGGADGEVGGRAARNAAYTPQAASALRRHLLRSVRNLQVPRKNKRPEPAILRELGPLLNHSGDRVESPVAPPLAIRG